MAGNLLTNQARGLYGAHHFSGKDVNLARGAILDVKDSAVLLRIVFDDANRETRSEIYGVFGGRNGIRAIPPHGFEPREGNGPELPFVQNSGVGFGHGFVRVGGRPVIRIFCGAEKRLAGTTVGIESGERPVDDDKGEQA